MAAGSTIYGVCRENIASRSMSLPSKPPTPMHTNFLPADTELQDERDYIDRLMFQDYTGDNFNKMIMQNFFKARKPCNMGYGMPRPETREGSVQNRLFSHLSRKPSVVRVPSHSSLCKHVMCESHNGCSGEFCEILGPGCCSSCIETTNRSIAEEIQRRLFPEIEVSRRCLVKPKLTKVMKEGHVKQVRRKRLNDLRQASKGTAITIVTQKNTEVSKTATKSATAKPVNTKLKRGDSMQLPPIGVPQLTFTPSTQGSHRGL
ncbi:uncharacterized protein LOC106014175 [Aplysia californica]|uniref:Uncharacterized protein LOC106014175 n=1 Tax=Aplysia californica TaxID=6500 RepID=A0ABM1AFN0_APLCA|nr:uncharacterized protein LOC106014175 [Aplysia californica]